ncbi:SPFH domain / Band 7 family [Phytophthora infestans]|uniref:SPFH domain / Band 7 family n=1 Tax=Phytophthora infestans TaxID=4787 RepID=A0A8S9UX26_PHYIN|nr:SPFH domain / Band 7 family [Phytophthora infestans]
MPTEKPARYNRLVQLDISRPMDAMGQFNAKVVDGRIPIVLIPSYPTFFTFMQQIPSGVWVLQQTWNAHAGMMNPGLKVFWPAWNRVSHIVTKQAVAYSNPVLGCLTADNVMVDIDISISFQIGPTEDDAVKFVYVLGAHRLDELLYSLTEEAIRGLVHSVRYDQFGVFIHNVKVTNVDLPPSLSSTLEGTTAFKTRMEEQEKNHENQLRILINEETQKHTAVQKENERAVQDLLAAKARANIIRNELRTTAEAKAQMTIAQHKAEYANKIKEAEGFKIDAVATVTAASVRAQTQPAVDLANLKQNYAQYIAAAKIKSDGMVKAAEHEAAKMSADAEAEAVAAAFLTEKRSFDYQQNWRWALHMSFQWLSVAKMETI